MRRVLLVSPYSEKLVGGIINWTRYIVGYYHECGGDFELQLLNNENAVQVTEATGTIRRLINGISNYIPVCRKYVKSIKDTKYDIVHICTSASIGLIRDLYLVNAAKRRGVKTAVHMHFGRIPKIIDSRGWEYYLLMRLVKKTDRVVVMDNASLVALNALGLRNVSFLPNPLSADVESIIEQQRGLKRESRKIVFAGHVLETKGVFELVNACRGIKNIKLEILGKIPNDSIRKQLMIEAGEDSEQWLSIPGNMPFEDVIKEMLTCSVFVLPSYSEGFPNVILESMACGCPIVATNVGAIPEMLEIDSISACGLCVPPKDPNELRIAILRMLDDQLLASQCGENAKKRVTQSYSMYKVWNELVGIWKELVI